MAWTYDDIRTNRAANLRMLICRYICAGNDDLAYDLTVRLVRLTETGVEE